MQELLIAVFTLAAAIWIGGYVAIVVVARAATASLPPEHRVAFFRSLGGAYLRVGGPALVVALATGGGLLADHPLDGTVTATVVVAAALILALVVGVAQARRMTRLRRASLQRPDDVQLAARVRSGARAAGMVRGLIGLLTLVLVVLGAVLAG